MDFLPAPRAPLFRLARFNPVRGQIRTFIDVARDRRPLWVTQFFVRLRRDPASAGEDAGPHEAACVEVVPLVPPVVGDLMTTVRLHHGEQDRTELDGEIVHHASIIVRARSRSSYLRILPLAFMGRASTTTTRRGTL